MYHVTIVYLCVIGVISLSLENALIVETNHSVLLISENNDENIEYSSRYARFTFVINHSILWGGVGWGGMDVQ